MAGGEAYDIDTSQFQESRIYADKPSSTEETDIGDSEGTAVEAVTAVQSEGEHTYLVEFSPITDPTPSDGADYEDYWIVTNYRVESGGPSIFIVDKIFLWRSSSLSSRISLEVSQLQALDRQLYKLFHVNDIADLIREARNDLIDDLRNLDDALDHFFNLDELNIVLKYRSLAYMARSVANEENRFWFEKYKDYKDEYMRVFDHAKVGHAPDKNVGGATSKGSVGLLHVPH